MADQTSQVPSSLQQPFLRPVKRGGSQNNLKNLQNRPEAENFFQWVTYRVQEINSAFIKPINKEIQKLSYEEAGEWVGKLFSGVGRPLTPISTGHLIEEALDFSNKNSMIRKITDVAMLPYTLFKSIQEGVKTDQNAEKKAAEIEAAGLEIIKKYQVDPKTLTQEENTWLMGHLERCFAGKTSTDTELDSSVARLAQLHLYSLQGRGA
jgi:hypothetical protein